MPLGGLGVLWLQPEDYPRFREICGNDVDDTYEEWRSRVEAKLKVLAKEGVDIERVLIKPDEFLAWCEENGFKPDGEARALYPAYLLGSREHGPGPMRRRPAD